MNRAQIKNKIDMFNQHKYYGELTEDDDILLWLMQHVYKLTEGMPEEQETVLPKKKKYVPQGAPGPVALNRGQEWEINPAPAAPVPPANARWVVDPDVVRIVERHRADLAARRERENIFPADYVVDEVNEQPR